MRWPKIFSPTGCPGYNREKYWHNGQLLVAVVTIGIAGSVAVVADATGRQGLEMIGWVVQGGMLLGMLWFAYHSGQRLDEHRLVCDACRQLRHQHVATHTHPNDNNDHSV